MSRTQPDLLGKIKVTRQLASWLDTCVRCGACAEACHIFRAMPEARHIPSYKAERFRRVYRRYHTWIGRKLPWLVGARDLTEEFLEEFRDLVYQCSMCRRCAMYCPFGVDNAVLIRALRTMLVAAGKAPASLQEVTATNLRTGNNLGLTREKFFERVEFINELLREETGNPGASLPVDRRGAQVLFMPTPLQLMKYVGVIVATAKVFRAAGVDWTLSSNHFDASNFGLFIGDDGAARTMAGRVMGEAERLGAKTLVITECGHAYRVAKLFASGWLQRKFPFQVKSILEVAADLVRSGRLRLRPEANREPVTYHDPCQLARNGGVLEEPRLLLGAACADFREMTPNRSANWCCGGGGGLAAVVEPELVNVRVKSGRLKADQVRATGATLLATACDNCKLTLQGLSEHYGLGVQVVGVMELVARAMA